MGLGKTRTGIAAACVYHRDWPVLVVCPSSARHHWYTELQTMVVTAQQQFFAQHPEEREKEERFHREKEESSKKRAVVPPQQQSATTNTEIASVSSSSSLSASAAPAPSTGSVRPIVIDMTQEQEQEQEQEKEIKPENTTETETETTAAKTASPDFSAFLQPFPVVHSSEIVLIEKANHFLQKSVAAHRSTKFFIISYSLIPRVLSALQAIPFQVMLVDESHYIKSRRAKRTKCIVPLIQRSKRAILLSGTPALSRPLELFTQLNALLPQQWNDFKAFGRRYCQDATGKQVNSLMKSSAASAASSSSAGSISSGASKSGGGYSLFSNSHHRFKGLGDNAYKGANHTQELHVILTSTIMIRRLKKDILLQLPKKKRYLMKIEIEDPRQSAQLEAMLLQLKKYEELIVKKNLGKRNKKLLLSNLNNNNNNSLGGAAEEEELTILKQAKKSILMKLFTQSGQAKLPAILKKLDLLFLQNPQFTGKVMIIQSCS